MSEPKQSVDLARAGDQEKETAINPADVIEPHILAKLDPDFVDYYVGLLAKTPSGQDVPIEEVRAHPEMLRPPCALDTTGRERVADHHVPSEDGYQVPVKVYYPDPARHGKGPYPVHLNFHGGGFVLGDLTSESTLCLGMADGAGVAVVDVNYRHCPEVVWGKCVQDAWAALRWARDSAASLGLNPRSVSVGGVSAGGHLSFILQHLARDAGVPLALCLAAVPSATDALGYRSYTDSPFASFREFRGAPALSWARLQWLGAYAFPQDGLRELRATWPDWWLAPIRAERWDGLCDTFVRTAEVDPLRDEGEAYGMKLVEGGSRVTLKRYRGAPHTFMYLDFLERKREYDADAVEALRQAHGLRGEEAGAA